MRKETIWCAGRTLHLYRFFLENRKPKIETTLEPFFGQFFQEGFLLLVKIGGGFHNDADELVSPALAIGRGEAVVFEAHLGMALGARRHLEAHGFAVQGGDRHLGAQGGFAELDPPVHQQVIALPFEDRVFHLFQLDIEIAGRAAHGTGAALAGEAQLFARQGAGGDFHRDLFHLALMAETHQLIGAEGHLVEGNGHFHLEVLALGWLDLLVVALGSAITEGAGSGPGAGRPLRRQRSG